MLSVVGLVLQVGGTLVAAWAAWLEWRSDHRPDPPVLKEPARSPSNPWTVRLDLPKHPRIRPADRRAWIQGDDVFPGPRGSDPELVQLTETMVAWLGQREGLLAKDWRRQRTLDEEMRAELTRLFNDQARVLADQQAATRRRLRWEMVGLAAVLVGTVLPQLG